MTPPVPATKHRSDTIRFGFVVNYPAAGIVETVGHLWDFLWFDAQHGQHSYTSLLNGVRAANLVGTESLVRVPGADPGFIGQVLDMMPSGLIVPMVNTREEAEQIVRASKFPPLGDRSYGGRRPIDLRGREYYQQEPTLTVQVETPEAVENVQAIAEAPGVDGILIGCEDIKLRLGLPIDQPIMESPVLLNMMEQVAEAAIDVGKFAACVAGSQELAEYAVSRGYRDLTLATDKGLLMESSQRLVDTVRHCLGAKNIGALQGDREAHGT